MLGQLKFRIFLDQDINNFNILELLTFLLLILGVIVILILQWGCTFCKTGVVAVLIRSVV